MATVFKKVGTKKYVKGTRIDFGFVSIKNKIESPFAGYVEKDALQDFHFRIRMLKETVCCNMITGKLIKLNARQILYIQYRMFNYCGIQVYICQKGNCIVTGYHEFEIMPLKHPLLAQIISPSGTVVRETTEELSRAIGVIPQSSIVLIDEKEFSYTYSDQLKLRLYKTKYYIPRSSVKLLGYADALTIACWLSPYIEYFPTTSYPVKRCVVCEEKYCDSTFVHGESGHSVCCYSCAKYIEGNDKRCPICRENISKVILNYF
jgi:hypothetical protein